MHAHAQVVQVPACPGACSCRGERGRAPAQWIQTEHTYRLFVPSCLPDTWRACHAWAHGHPVCTSSKPWTSSTGHGPLLPAMDLCYRPTVAVDLFYQPTATGRQHLQLPFKRHGSLTCVAPHRRLYSPPARSSPAPWHPRAQQSDAGPGLGPEGSQGAADV